MSFELFLLKYFLCFVPFFLLPLQHIFLLRTYFSNSLYFFHLGFYFYSFRTLSSFCATLPFSFISTSPFSLFQLLSHTSTSRSYFPLCSFFLPSYLSLFLLFFSLSSPPFSLSLMFLFHFRAKLVLRPLKHCHHGWTACTCKPRPQKRPGTCRLAATRRRLSILRCHFVVSLSRDR